ncbi:MAG: general secretion pathway protein GspB, partial [Candidatus Hydrogenedentota bacterium]
SRKHMSIILKALKKIQEQKAAQSPAAAAAGLENGERAVGGQPLSAPKARHGKADAEAVSRKARMQDEHRFGSGPKILLGLMVALGIFATGWFVNRLYSNYRSVADTEKAGLEAGSGQPQQFIRATQIMPPQTQPAVSVSQQVPALGTGETTLSAAPPAAVPVPVSAAPAVPDYSVEPPSQRGASEPEERPSERVEPEPKPPGPEQMRLSGKEAQPAREGRPELKINAIAWRAREPKAIVNMQRVYVGDVIEGATVLAIRRKSILFEYDGEAFEVRF